MKNTTTTPTGAAITLKTKVKLASALRRGLPVRVSGVPAGSHRVVAATGGKTVASGTARVGRTGRAATTLRFTAKAKRSLAKRRSVTLALKAGKARGTVTLKR